MTEGNRPSPDSLLALATEEEQKAKRGKLKIFFGSSAGVGKTYSMLSAAQELHKKGVQVVVGIVETHQRPHTQKLLEGLPVLPPVAIPYRGLQINELDLDKAIELAPHTILVDELAHTNTPGSRHPKRWNDVLELLDEGINVFTTLNVQHIESLSDLVAGTTGIWVRETVPDSVFDMADDVVLVDIDTDDLIKRLHEGNVYIAPGANKRAAENFFKKENLDALREIALRRTAERVDAERGAGKELSGKTAISEKLLVCVGPDKNSAKLVRSTKRMASGLKAPWTAIYVERGDPQSKANSDNRRAIEVLERMVSRLDGKMVTLHGEDLRDEILSYARQHKITKIIVGKDSNFTLRGFFEGLLVNRLIKYSGSIDIIVITEDKAETQPEEVRRSALADLKPFNYLISFLVVTAFTIPGFFLSAFITATDQALLYLAGIVLVAENLSLGAALFYALLASSAFSIFFATSNHFLQTDDRAYIMTFLVMLITGFVVAKQSSKLKSQAISSRLREDRMRALYELTRQLTSTHGRFPVSEIVVKYLAKTFNVTATVWMINQEGNPSVIIGQLPESTYYKDFGALQWCFESNKPAGHGTSTMPSASGYYIPLSTSTGALGVLGIYPNNHERLFTNDETSSMETLATLLASALERVRSGEIAQHSLIEKENLRFRESLLSVFDNSQTTVLQDGRIEPDDKAFDGQSPFLSASASPLRSNKLPSSILERIEAVIERKQALLAQHNVRVDVEPNIPEVLVDAVLVEQLITCLIENAVRFSTKGTNIVVSATRFEREILVTIEDEGRGFPKGLESKIFSKHPIPYDQTGANPTGLGLTIAAGIVQYHNGRISAENKENGGAKVTFSLPIA